MNKGTKHFFPRFLLSSLAAFIVAPILLPKRMLLVDATELVTYPDMPWYYVPFHCESMFPWNEVSSGAPFCIAADLRVAVLVPLALAFLLTALWLHLVQKKKK